MQKNKILRRLTAFLLSAVFLFTGVAQTFAWNPNEEERCGSKIGAQYLASDGRNYMDVAEDYYVKIYHPDGSSTVELREGRYKVRRHLILFNPTTKEERWVYCIESGVDFDISDSAYLSENMNNNKYFMNLPTEAREGIMMVTMYGHQPGKAIPVAGLNADDAFYAGQILIWEYQQGIRTDASARKDNGKIKADVYYNLIKDRPAEKMYHYILEKIRLHSVVPSFSSPKQEAAPQITLEYDKNTKKYSKTVKDSNNSNVNLLNLTGLGVTVTRSGNQYTFTSDKVIERPITIKMRKDIPVAGGKFLVWGRPGYQSVCTGTDDPVAFYMKIQTESFGNAKIVKTSEDGKISGIRFHISGDGVEQDVTTGQNGEIQVDNLRPGIYTVTEQTEDRYEPQEIRRVTVVPGQTSTVTFNNTLKRGDLQVTKTSEDGFVEGVKFHLFGTSVSGLQVDEYAVTDSKGVAIFEDVLIGTGYVLSEVDTDDKYVIPDNQTAAVEWDTVTNKSFHNILKKWNAVVTKSDKEFVIAQGNASLAGAVYGVYKGNQLVDTYTTDENGQFTTKEYICGNDWSIREVTPSEGYLLDSTVYYVGAESQKYVLEHNQIAIDVLETVRKGKIVVIKHCDDGGTQIETPETGAEFKVFLKSADSYEKAKDSERDILICNKFGFAQTKPLPCGIYTVKQTKGWDGKELMPAFDVFVREDGEIYQYLINNATFKSLVEIVKKDAETGKVIPAAGIGFKVKNTDTGEFVVQHMNYPTPMDLDIFYTDSTGKLMLPEALDYGNYEVVEVQTCNGYVLNSTPVPFKVDGTQKVITVEKRNVPQKGKITISKSGEVLSSVTETDGLYQPVYSVSGLADAIFEIYADEDIVTPDGTIRTRKGEIVSTIETDGSGKAVSNPLYLGRYKIIEKKASYGMVVNKEPIYAELTYAGQEVDITFADIAACNERQKVQIDLAKVLEQDKLFGIGMNDEILSVQFGLFAAEDIKAADGETIPKDGLLEVVYCNTSGKATFKTDIPVGAKLYVKEISTDVHYLISDKIYPVEFEYAGQDVATVKIAVNNGKPIENKLIYGTVVGKKVDEDGFAICGALFGLFKSDEANFIKSNAILTAESNEIGVFGFGHVPFRKWLVRELQPAPAFVLNETEYTVTISENEQIIKIEIENRFITGAVQTTKVDAEYPDHKLTGAVFEVYVDVNGNKIYDAYIDKLIGEMDEIETGVYRMNRLRYNGYFLYEKSAPEGYIQDNRYYYFEIREDGEIVVVENMAGVGFVNQPVIGGLEITKKDISDGKLLPGVGFQIKNENGKIVAQGYTDENGAAKFSLRYGKYTYQEFAPLDGYKPDNTEYPFEIKENGEVIKAEMANEKISTPPVPETGTGNYVRYFVVCLSGAMFLFLSIRRRCFK